MRWLIFRNVFHAVTKVLRPSEAAALPPSNSPTEVHNLENPESMASAIFDELNSGRIPPYSVQGTYVLLKLQSDGPGFTLSQYQEVMDVYRAKLAKLRSHHVEFFFREYSDCDHRLLAFSFYRDMLRASSVGGKKSVYGFISSGWLEFGEKNNEPEFFGELMSTLQQYANGQSESGDSLGFIHKSLIECYSSHGQFLETPGSFARIQKFTSISDVLETYQPLDSASYYRNPDDLAETLNYVSEKIVEGDLIELKDAFYRLKTFKLGEKSTALLNSYKSLLNLLIRLYRINLDMKHLISSCLTVAPHLLASDSFDEELKELFNWCLQFKDPRIKANTLEALGHFDPDNPDIDHFAASKFNRVASEALIIHGRKELDENLTQQIVSFLNSANPFFVASGLYLVGFICEYHFQKDYSYFNTNPHFHTLIKQAARFENHPHSMIRKRAQATLKMIKTLKGAA